MPTLTRKDLRNALEVVEFVAGHSNYLPIGSDVRIDEVIQALERALAPRRHLARARKRRELKKDIRRQEVRDLRTIVMTRAGGKCEQCGQVGFELELDHFFGGSNRRFLESVETTWALCSGDHRSKTKLSPTAEFWFERFIEHATVHGYHKVVSLARNRLQFIQTRKRLHQSWKR